MWFRVGNVVGEAGGVKLRGFVCQYWDFWIFFFIFLSVFVYKGWLFFVVRWQLIIWVFFVLLGILVFCYFIFVGRAYSLYQFFLFFENFQLLVYVGWIRQLVRGWGQGQGFFRFFVYRGLAGIGKVVGRVSFSLKEVFLVE